MELNFNCTGNERKRLVNTISEITGAPVKYLGAPSFAYQVDYFTIGRNGSVSFDDRADSEEIKNLIDTLGSQGFTAELKVDETFGPVEPATAEADGLCISMPASLFSEMALQKFGIPATNLTTKGESIEFSTPSIEGTVTRRNKVDGQGKHPWKAEVSEDDTGVLPATISGWYEEVYEPDYSTLETA